MASPAVTYTFINSQTSDGPQVSTNFADLIAAMTDGTKDFAIAALSCTNLTATGNSQFGDATSDTIDPRGRFINNLVPSTDAARDLGTSALKWATVYSSALNTATLVASSTATVLSLAVTGGTGANNTLYLSSNVLSLRHGSSGFALVNTSGTTYLSGNDSGAVTIGASSSTQTHTINGYQIDVTAARSGGTVASTVNNTSNTASSNAIFLAIVGGTSAADAYTQYQVSGTSNWVMGLDNSDSDAFVISSGNALGTNNIARGTSTTLQIKGTATNDAASTGWVGEEVKSEVTSDQNISSSATFFDMTSITLTAGDWDIEGAAVIIRSGATFTATDFFVGVGTASGTSSTGTTLPVNSHYQTDVCPTSFTRYMANAPTTRVSISGSTTYYLKGFIGNFSAGTPVYRCVLRARRLR